MEGLVAIDFPVCDWDFVCIVDYSRSFPFTILKNFALQCIVTCNVMCTYPNACGHLGTYGQYNIDNFAREDAPSSTNPPLLTLF